MSSPIFLGCWYLSLLLVIKNLTAGEVPGGGLGLVAFLRWFIRSGPAFRLHPRTDGLSRSPRNYWRALFLLSMRPGPCPDMYIIGTRSCSSGFPQAGFGIHFFLPL